MSRRRWVSLPPSYLLNSMGWVIGSSCYWAYAIYFWALVQSNMRPFFCLIRDLSSYSYINT
jgi:hypothetical protein